MKGDRFEESVKVVQSMSAPGRFLEDVLRRCGLIDGYAVVQSPIGVVYAAMGERGITAVMEASSETEFEGRYRERFGRRVERRDQLSAELQNAMQRGSRAKVDLSECNPFQRAVLEATRRIRPGTVRPYAWIAREIGHPGAVRAVGTALAKNPVPLIVPCHRVVRSDGETGEYALGADDKVRILEHEGVHVPELRRRVTMHEFWSPEGDDTFCYPFCFSEPQLHGRHFRKFQTPQEAVRLGLTPCETCHPPLAA
ncbi:MAG: MGMT family protein [Candidatus Eremiobacteraeota bacterium]|nr:MGMT family protein [Candidatus Eremiobacteraeota bacterium]